MHTLKKNTILVWYCSRFMGQITIFIHQRHSYHTFCTDSDSDNKSAQHFWNFTEVINLIIINWPKFWDISQQAPTSYRLFTKNIKYVYGLYMYTKNIKYIYNTGVFNKCRYILTKILKRLINYIRKPSLIITLSVSKKGLWRTDRQTWRRTLL